MRGVLLILGLFFLGTLANNHTLESRLQDLENWKRVADGVLTMTTFGPLPDGFSPDELKKRTRQAVIATQANRFRAVALRSVIEATEDYVLVCPPEPTTLPHAIAAVLHDFQQHGFTARWVPSKIAACPERPGFLFILVPPLEKEEEEKK